MEQPFVKFRGRVALLDVLDIVIPLAVIVGGLVPVIVFEIHAEAVLVQEKGPGPGDDDGAVERKIEPDGEERALRHCVRLVEAERGEHGSAHAELGLRRVGRASQHGNPHVLVGADGIPAHLSQLGLRFGRGVIGDGSGGLACRRENSGEQEDEEYDFDGVAVSHNL